MRCILHIGTEKTGTTAIQQHLYANRAAIRASGIAVCTSLGKGNNRALSAAFVSNDKSDDFHRSNNIEDAGVRETWKQKIFKSLSREVSKARDDACAIVISSEHLHSRLVSPGEVVALHDFLEPLFDKIDIICYLRRQDKMALSRYSEALRAGLTPASPLPRGVLRGKTELPAYFNFEALLNRWADAFGEQSIKPRIYSRTELLGGDVVQDFLRVLGVTSSDTAIAERKNIALSAEAQTVLLGVNKSLKESDWEAARKIRTPLVEYLQKYAAGESRKPTASHAEAFYRVFEPSNTVVAKRWFGRDTLFDTDFSKYPQERKRIDHNRVVELMAGFILECSG